MDRSLSPDVMGHRSRRGIPSTSGPRLVSPTWPVMVQDGRGGQLGGAAFMVSHASREENGSDVNTARRRPQARRAQAAR
jgi:hypothetical protein